MNTIYDVWLHEYMIWWYGMLLRCDALIWWWYDMIILYEFSLWYDDMILCIDTICYNMILNDMIGLYDDIMWWNDWNDYNMVIW